MTRFTIEKKTVVKWGAAVLLLVLWQISAERIDREIILPSPLRVLAELAEIFRSRKAWLVVGKTLERSGRTFLIDLAFALLTGVPAGLFPLVEQGLKPVETAVRAIPTMGVILLALIWLDSEAVPIFVTSLIVYPILYRAVVDGIRNVDPRLIAFHKVHRVGFAKTLRFLYFPSVLPFLKVGIAASLGLCLKVMITAEVLSQPALAIGTVFQVERAMLNTAAVMAWCIVVVLLSAAAEWGIHRIFLRKGGNHAS